MLEETLGTKEWLEFEAWWEERVVAWFLKVRRECGELGIPSVQDVEGERKEMKMMV